LLLLAYADDTGKPLLDSTRLNAGLAGATVLELTVLGVLDIADARGAGPLRAALPGARTRRSGPAPGGGGRRLPQQEAPRRDQQHRRGDVVQGPGRPDQGRAAPPPRRRGGAARGAWQGPRAVPHLALADGGPVL